MPKAGSYGSMKVGDSVASELKRGPASRVSYDNTKRRPYSGSGEGKFGGVSAMGVTVSGGSMGKGAGKQRGAGSK